MRWYDDIFLCHDAGIFHQDAVVRWQDEQKFSQIHVQLHEHHKEICNMTKMFIKMTKK